MTLHDFLHVVSILLLKYKVARRAEKEEVPVPMDKWCGE